MSRKNVFSINLDSDKVIDFDTFIRRQESENLAKWREEMQNTRLSYMNKNLKYSAILYVAGLVGFVILRFAAKFAGFYATTMVILAVLLLASTVVSAVWLRKHSKKKEKEAQKRFEEEYASYEDIVKNELRIPKDAKKVEVFTYMYSKEGGTFPKEYAIDTATVFEEEGHLCFRYDGVVLGFPLSELEGVAKVNKTIFFNVWERDESFDSESFLPYHIQEIEDSEHGCYYSMQGYYSVRLTRDGTPYEIIIPPYDMDPILEILKVEPTAE